MLCELFSPVTDTIDGGLKCFIEVIVKISIFKAWVVSHYQL